MDIDALIKLQKLKEKGIISEKEFNAEKYKIINNGALKNVHHYYDNM